MSDREVEERLDLDALIDALAAAHADLSAGRVSMPTPIAAAGRVRMRPRIGAGVEAKEGLLIAMPAYLPSAGVLSTKLVSLFPQNDGSALPTHQAVILAFAPDTGSPLALLAGTAVTAIRTGA